MQGNEKKISEAKFKGYMCYMWVNVFVNGAIMLSRRRITFIKNKGFPVRVGICRKMYWRKCLEVTSALG